MAVTNNIRKLLTKHHITYKNGTLVGYTNLHFSSSKAMVIRGGTG